MAVRTRKRRPKSAEPIRRRQQIIGALLWFTGALLSLSLFSGADMDHRLILDGNLDLMALRDSSQLVYNQGGVIGAYLALTLFFLLGKGAFLAAGGLLIGGACFWNPRYFMRFIRPASLSIALGMAILTLLDSLGRYSNLATTYDRPAIEILSGAGGYLSLKINYLALNYLGGFGSTLVLITVPVLLLLLALPASLKLHSVSGIAPLLRFIGKASGALFSVLGDQITRLGSLLSFKREGRVRLVDGEVRPIDEAPGSYDDDFEERLRSALARPAPAPVSGDNQRQVTQSSSAPDSAANFAENSESPAEEKQTTLQLGDYEYPHLGLLTNPPRVSSKTTRLEMTEMGSELRDTLATFGIRISGDVTMIPGPVVTRYEFRPALGVKVNQILNLADDLALALRAKRIRIVAPIPGKAAVGIEVPNRRREVVYLKDIMACRDFNSTSMALPLALGKLVSGEPFVADLARMPHLLIAGATGAGKSVCINTIITSLLYRLGPADLRFLFIDPKMLELSVYAGIPHLERPVVTDPRKAERALASAVMEMESRYKKLAIHSCRNIVDYNLKMEDPSRKLPYLVIIIDELADLMMTQSSAKTEMLITRLAQMARAVGIHLVLATQRPSVDVITGLIKANFPSRIAFHVASKTDSRTILDGNGAEKLLGMGDMLFLQSGQPEAIRLHGPLISSDETETIVAKIRQQRIEVARIENVAQEISDEPADSDRAEEKIDPLYLEALKVVLHHKQASVSLLQRRLGIGYQRAARLVDRMEANGVVGSLDGSRARAVLVDSSYIDRLQEGAPDEAQGALS